MRRPFRYIIIYIVCKRLVMKGEEADVCRKQRDLSGSHHDDTDSSQQRNMSRIFFPPDFKPLKKSIDWFPSNVWKMSLSIILISIFYIENIMPHLHHLCRENDSNPSEMFWFHEKLKISYLCCLMPWSWPETIHHVMAVRVQITPFCTITDCSVYSLKVI